VLSSPFFGFFPVVPSVFFIALDFLAFEHFLGMRFPASFGYSVHLLREFGFFRVYRRPFGPFSHCFSLYRRSVLVPSDSDRSLPSGPAVISRFFGLHGAFFHYFGSFPPRAISRPPL
jgi:hypothetical protein